MQNCRQNTTERMMDGQTHRSKSRSEPTKLAAGMRHELGSKMNRRGANSKSTIWDTLEEAKKKQETIRNRVRKYGQDDDDSDYNDSPSHDAPLHEIQSSDCGTNLQLANSETDIGECESEFKLEPPLNNAEEVDKNRASFRRYSSSSPGSNFTASRSGSFQNQALEINTDTSANSIHSVDDQTQQSQTRIKYRARKNSLSARRGEKQPVLTPEEAIRLVMERHSYISDSERTEDDHPLPTRKFSKGSSSTNETAMNTVNSDSGHNRTPEGKRVLVLRKKFREDTHPFTSKQKLSQKSLNEGTHIQASQQNEMHQPNQCKQRHRQQDDSTSSVTKKSDRIQTKSNTSRTTTKPELSQLVVPSIRIREKVTVEDNKSRSNSQRKQEQKKIVETNDSQLLYQYDVVDEVDDDGLDDGKEIYIEHHPQHRFEEVSGRGETTKEEPLLQAYPPVDNEVIIKKEIVLLNTNDDDHLSESDSDCYCDENNDDLVSTDDGYIQLSLNPSKKLECINVAIHEDREIILPEQSDGEDIHVGDDEDDWRAVSWKTAKTSRTAASKISKSSSTSIWMKGVGEGDGKNNQDDDIFFFDAIQDAGQMDSQASTNATDGPPAVITHKIIENSSSLGQIDELGPKEQGGWAEKITSFVGYTIGTLSGSKDANDGKDSKVYNISRNTPVISPATTPRSTLNKSNSPSKPVPSRELEIIKKCQALMKSQRSLVQTREKESERNLLEDIRLRRKEEAARARVWREVMAYREMMEGMGKSDKLAPLNSKDAAQEYDDRLSMIKTLQDQEKKMKIHEQNMKQMELGTNDEAGKDPRSCGCSCTIS